MVIHSTWLLHKQLVKIITITHINIHNILASQLTHLPSLIVGRTCYNSWLRSSLYFSTICLLSWVFSWVSGRTLSWTWLRQTSPEGTSILYNRGSCDCSITHPGTWHHSEYLPRLVCLWEELEVVILCVSYRNFTSASASVVCLPLWSVSGRSIQGWTPSAIEGHLCEFSDPWEVRHGLTHKQVAV